MEQQTAAPEPERRALSLAEAADAIAELPDDVLGGGGKAGGDAAKATSDERDPVSGWTRAEEPADDAGEPAEAVEPEPGDADAEDDGSDPLVAVTLPDGEARELPLSELVRGYSRTEEHQRKSTELARERERLLQDQRQFAQDLERWVLAQALDAPPPPELAQQDAAEYGRQQAAWQQRAQAREAALQHYEAMKQQETAASAGRLAMHREHERRQLHAAWPELADPQAGPRLRQDIYRGLAEEYGFAEADLNALYNHRTILMARDALAYRRMQKAKPGVQAMLREKPVTMKPGAKQGRGVTDASRLAAKRERLRRSGSLRDAAALFEEMDL